MAMQLADMTRPKSAPLSVLGALIIAPNGVPRRLLNVCRDAFEDVSGCLSESRHHDADHDRALLLADELAERGVQLATVNGCPCGARYKAIRRAIKTAQAADDREDHLIEAAWCVAKRLAGAIGKALVLRKGSRR